MEEVPRTKSVLIAGATGYIGRHVGEGFLYSGYNVFTYNRSGQIACYVSGREVNASELVSYFDVIVNCARPHWSEFSPEEIAQIEFKLLQTLDTFAANNATKIHTSGVWLFGHATSDDLLHFRLQPLKVVEPDVRTINNAIEQKWHIVYCPSVVYGGENCQLQRIVQSLANQSIQVAIPSEGHNQYVHVHDVARFYLSLAQEQPTERQHFIAEPQGYCPEEFAQLLLKAQVIKSVEEVNWAQFESNNGIAAVEIEKLNLVLPISPLFKTKELVCRYIKKQGSIRAFDESTSR
ncbi:NAD-dependent epimerase/dehydratase family protein [Vibrio sinaloensis]|uniref:NAD-dependent epimerase/dehydratase family protein n=1 Tax=Photobacterium sp. (strain ATCC 43367) TaxID=379097 RepID=UPI00057CA94A|nr:NAD-dependent epimerase/dehydratase family protein [Vibrio sinaloensis]KHT47250.1 NAD-dependent dehydratase [Vibrio sinaloensis]